MDETGTVRELDILVAARRKFSTIYADPPWRYSNQATRASVDVHYKDMSVDEIAALPVGELAADICHLHLWTTNGMIFECPKIFEAWGFEYRSMFIWCKPEMGIGNYWRVGHETLLFARRGVTTFIDKGLDSWGVFKRGAHSAKPEAIRRLIERASPPPRLELFARRIAAGWVSWGNQIERTMFDRDVEEIS